MLSSISAGRDADMGRSAIFGLCGREQKKADGISSKFVLVKQFLRGLLCEMFQEANYKSANQLEIKIVKEHQLIKVHIFVVS